MGFRCIRTGKPLGDCGCPDVYHASLDVAHQEALDINTCIDAAPKDVTHGWSRRAYPKLPPTIFDRATQRTEYPELTSNITAPGQTLTEELCRAAWGMEAPQPSGTIFVSGIANVITAKKWHRNAPDAAHVFLVKRQSPLGYAVEFDVYEVDDGGDLPANVLPAPWATIDHHNSQRWHIHHRPWPDAGSSTMVDQAVLMDRMIMEAMGQPVGFPSVKQQPGPQNATVPVAGDFGFMAPNGATMLEAAGAQTRICNARLPRHPVTMKPDEVSCWRCQGTTFEVVS